MLLCVIIVNWISIKCMMGKSIKFLKDPALISKTLDCFNGKYQIRHFSLLKVSVTVGIEIEYFLQHKKIIGKGDFRFIGLCYLVFMVTSSNVSAIPCLPDLFGAESLQTNWQWKPLALDRFLKPKTDWLYRHSGNAWWTTQKNILMMGDQCPGLF